MEIWIATVIIAFIKISSIVAAFHLHRKFAAEHTRLNKLSGLRLLIFPFTVNLIDVKYSAAILCVVTLTAVVQEWYCIRILSVGVNKKIQEETSSCIFFVVF